MAKFEETGPSKPTTEATRVDKITPRYRFFHNVRAIAVVIIAILLLIPIFVMVITAFKARQDIVSSPPSVIFSPTLEGFVYLFTERAVASPSRLEELKSAADAGEMSLFERIALDVGQDDINARARSIERRGDARLIWLDYNRIGSTGRDAF